MLLISADKIFVIVKCMCLIIVLLWSNESLNNNIMQYSKQLFGSWARFVEEKAKKNGKNLAMNVLVEQVNDDTNSLLRPTDVGVEMWRALDTINSYNDSRWDGIHIHNHIITVVQMMLDYICNAERAREKGRCCEPKPAYSPRQPTVDKLVFVFTGVCWVASVVLFVTKCLVGVIAWINKPRRPLMYLKNDHLETEAINNRNAYAHTKDCLHFLYDGNVDYYQVAFGLSKLGLLLSLYIIFERQEKLWTLNDFSLVTFFLVVSIFLAVGWALNITSKQTQLLQDDQVIELKGWAVTTVLVCNVTGASQNTSGNHLIMYAFLFLGGYVYFMEAVKEEFHLHRTTQVLLRYNLLTVLLFVTTERQHMVYYLGPRLSFSFLVTSLCVPVWRRISHITATISQRYPMLLIFFKLNLLVAVIYVFLHLLNLMFNPLKQIYSLSEWSQYWCADAYSMLYGIMGAVLVLNIRNSKYLDYLKIKISYSYSSILFGTLIYLDIMVAICNCADRRRCVEMYASASVGVLTLVLVLTVNSTANATAQAMRQFLHISLNVIYPVLIQFGVNMTLCYLFLRHVLSFIKQRYSILFSFFGSFYIELLIVQHQLCSTDNNGKIVMLVPQFSGFNAIVTSVICVCAAHEIHQITRTLIDFILPNDLKKYAKHMIISVNFAIVTVITSDIINLICI